MNKENLEQEIRDLENEVYNTTGYKNDRSFLKTEYEEAKKEYKRDKKKVRKIKNIKNLKVTGYVSLMLLPFVVSAGIWYGSFIFMNAVLADKEPVNVGDEIKVVSMTNTGEYDEKIGESCKDTITLKTKWLEDGKNLVRYTYELEDDIDFHTKEELEKVVNTDYFILLNKYNFNETNKEIAEITEERLKEDLGKEIVSVKATIGIDDIETAEWNSSIKKEPVGAGFVAALISTIVPIFSFVLYIPQTAREAAIKTKWNTATKLENIDILSEKNKVKQLKKELKKRK